MAHGGNCCTKKQLNFLHVLIMIDLYNLIEGSVNKQQGGEGNILLKLIDGGPSNRD